MTDLSDWGGGIDPSDGEHDDDLEGDGHESGDGDSRGSGGGGRCRALVAGGTRCPAEAVEEAGGGGLCDSHGGDAAVISIDDDPAYVIGATAGDLWPEPAEEVDGWDEITAALEPVSVFDWGE